MIGEDEIEIKNQRATEEINLLDVIALRGNIYSFISRGFSHEIDRKFLDRMREHLPMLKELEGATEDSDYTSGVARLEEFLKKIENDENLIEEYGRKFVSIFFNMFNVQSKNVNPFESVYLSPERLIMQEPRDRVVEFYAAYGHGISEKFNEPEDHIAAELSFLSSLNGEILKDIHSGSGLAEIVKKLEEHLEFMKKHLLFPAQRIS